MKIRASQVKVKEAPYFGIFATVSSACLFQRTKLMPKQIIISVASREAAPAMMR